MVLVKTNRPEGRLSNAARGRDLSRFLRGRDLRDSKDVNGESYAVPGDELTPLVESADSVLQALRPTEMQHNIGQRDDWRLPTPQSGPCVVGISHHIAAHMNHARLPILCFSDGDGAPLPRLQRPRVSDGLCVVSNAADIALREVHLVPPCIGNRDKAQLTPISGRGQA
jgi:hypothetical protein